jgi:hypothetical protein
MMNQNCVEVGRLLLKWGFVSEEVLASTLVLVMKTELSLLEILVAQGHITLYQKLFILMEASTQKLRESSAVAGTFGSLPTSSVI